MTIIILLLKAYELIAEIIGCAVIGTVLGALASKAWRKMHPVKRRIRLDRDEPTVDFSLTHDED